MSAFNLKTAAVLSVAALLAALGGYNGYLKARWNPSDDGVFWVGSPQGVVAQQIDPEGPAGRAGILPGDVLLAINDQDAVSALQVRADIAARPAGSPASYAILRAQEAKQFELQVETVPKGNTTLFYALSLLGFFSLLVGTVVMWRRPWDRITAHFYAICLLFFSMYSLSFAGQLSLVDWSFYWIDRLAILFLPAAFLHFCLIFPERRLAKGPWPLVAVYAPALLALAASAINFGLMIRRADIDALWAAQGVLDRLLPVYFGAFFAASFVVLHRAHRRTRSVVARRQMKWLVWGTGAGVVPFLALYAIPFALGRHPGAGLELMAYLGMAVIPLSLAYAVVKHRLMDVDLIFRRTLVFTLATVAVVAVSLVANGAVEFFLHGDEPHAFLIAVLCTIVVLLLFAPVKGRIQEAVDRLFLRDRYKSRKALLRLSRQLNAELDLVRTAERLLEGITAALGVRAAAVFLAEADGAFGVLRSVGISADTETPRLPASSPLLYRLRNGRPASAGTARGPFPEADGFGLVHYFPCVVNDELIGVLGVGLKEGLEPLDSEELDVLQALASQAATAFMNGRLYRSLRHKAEELQRLTEYNQNILESMDAGIVVLDLEGRVARWNRAMESLVGRRREMVVGRLLSEVLPSAFVDALSGSLGAGPHEEISHIYKLHLQTDAGRSSMVNVSVAPFQWGSGERLGHVLILEDITARVRLEEQLQHSEKMASIGLLAAGVAHEVNTPLAGISSYTQLLRAEVADADPRAPLLEKIEKQTFRAARIINNLLNFSRAGSSDLGPIDINRVLGDVLSLVEHQLDAARIKVRREMAPELPPVRGNENKIQQVFFNLILNARDAMPKGGWLTLKTDADASGVTIEVADTGHGISKEDVKRIYDPFFTTKGIGRGTGLGLSVTYGILQEHGGAIFVDSAPGKGTTFQVTLPADRMVEAARR